LSAREKVKGGGTGTGDEDLSKPNFEVKIFYGQKITSKGGNYKQSLRGTILRNVEIQPQDEGRVLSNREIAQGLSLRKSCLRRDKMLGTKMQEMPGGGTNTEFPWE